MEDWLLLTILIALLYLFVLSLNQIDNLKKLKFKCDSNL